MSWAQVSSSKFSTAAVLTLLVIGLAVGSGRYRALAARPASTPVTLSTCTFMALQKAVAKGGDIEFGCSGEITFTSPVIVDAKPVTLSSNSWTFPPPLKTIERLFELSVTGLASTITGDVNVISPLQPNSISPPLATAFCRAIKVQVDSVTGVDAGRAAKAPYRPERTASPITSKVKTAAVENFDDETCAQDTTTPLIDDSHV